MLLGSITDYPETLCRAIGEHHERLDGSGYPARLTGPDCSELGRLLAVVEVTVGILRGGRSPLTVPALPYAWCPVNSTPSGPASSATWRAPLGKRCPMTCWRLPACRTRRWR